MSYKNHLLALGLLLSLSSCFDDLDDATEATVITPLSPTDSNNPNPFSGVMAPIEIMPYASISTNRYCIDLQVWDIPNDRREPVKTTDNIQAAIDWAVAEGYGEICLPAGHYLIGKYGNDIYQAGLVLESNTAFLLDQNAVIEMAPNDKWNYCAIAVRGKSNVVISGGTLLGDRDGHEYTPRTSDGATAHDEGHLICIEGESEFVTVENVTLGKANGDGVLMVGSPNGSAEQLLRAIEIRRNNFSDNRRQGISLVGSSEVLIENNEIHHTNGVSPQFGIDLEGAGRLNENVTIRTNYFHNNRGGDIVNTDGKNILVEDNILLQGDDSQYIDGPIVYWKNADWTIRNNSITMRTVSVNNWNGIIMYSNDNPKTNPATTFIYNNTLNNCGMYMYKGADLEITDNFMDNGHLAFKEMTNLTLENNAVDHPSECWAYRFLEVSGSATGNTYNGAPFDIPLQENTPWDGCWIN
ncbi:right-handed parallel beta-helix repeat-containing protein [Psychroserpens sp. NJDZ02]|uniref:right-handed parallel beta-helix repeat-containing protein n=1 Tax=Psychroserpens sp. NJDZ02 TaxID=2570561 RepID=UPI0010A85CC8|nr:right-handed parallel beta-helix repeat-containing protein [Psychroserpens sp. NJDZ02]QCE42851.1 right-handed parallel beta-helix repeat-containing protein [Psychroserpens sp. NJDZ02]